MRSPVTTASGTLDIRILFLEFISRVCHERGQRIIQPDLLDQQRCGADWW
ncbi:MAG: hypothetical protein KAT18_04810 [Candidatus Latescibacteria bacterium]|nr:hypothetical protein [Candidatus Latescibacterota bacterium]